MASPRSGTASSSRAARRKPCVPGQSSKRNYILEYVDAINSGQVVVGRRIRRWYNKIADRIRKGHYKHWHFDLDRANRPIEFIQQFCRRSDGKHFGEQIVLDLWQKAFIQTLFGFIDDHGNRQFQEALLLVARKNGKTVSAISKCRFSPKRDVVFLRGSIQVLYSLIHHITCGLEARQALIYQLVSGLTGESGKYNYSKAVHRYPPFFDIFCSPKNYKTASALTLER